MLWAVVKQNEQCHLAPCSAQQTYVTHTHTHTHTKREREREREVRACAHTWSHLHMSAPRYTPTLRCAAFFFLPLAVFKKIHCHCCHTHHAHVHAHAHTHTHMHTRTHTHTHTHTRAHMRAIQPNRARTVHCYGMVRCIATVWYVHCYRHIDLVWSTP